MLRRSTKITLAIMGGGLAIVGILTAVESHASHLKCEEARSSGKPEIRDSCSHGSGGHGGSGTAGNHSQESTLSPDTSIRGGFGETGGHAGSEGGGHGGGGGE